MKMKKMFGTLTAKFAVLAIACGLAGGAWGDNVAKIGEVGYETLAAALADAKSGDVISVLAGACEIARTAVIPANVTIVGAGKDSTTVVITSETGDGVKITQPNVKIGNMTIDGSAITSGGYKSLINVKADGVVIDSVVMTGGGSSTWNSSILVESIGSSATFMVTNSTISGSFRGVLRESCNANIVIVGCDIDAVYPFNIDGGNGGTVVVRDSALHGWTSYSGIESVTFTNCEFSKAKSGYDVVAAYVDTSFVDCSFDSNADVYAQTSGFTFSFSGCTVAGTGLTRQNFSTYFTDSDVWNKCKCYVDGTDVLSIDTSAPVSQGEVTSSSATYEVGMSMMGDNLGTQSVTLKVAGDDIAQTTISDINASNVVAAAVATAGGAAEKISVEIKVVAEATSTGAAEVKYEVHPEAVVTVTKGGVTTESQPIEFSNNDLATNASFTFVLDVTDIAAVGDNVKVTHISDDPNYADETFVLTATAGGRGAVVTVTTTHFSEFVATTQLSDVDRIGLQPSVTNSVASANVFGAIAITDSMATNAFVAVPFGAFGAGDAQIAAADLVQAAALSEGDKMYVYNGEVGSYDVYVVANGAWTVANKVTVAADGTFTPGNVASPAERKVAAGTGVFIERKDVSKPIYVYGQVLANAAAETTFGSGLTLVSAPSTNAMAAVNLNALTWSGVTDATGRQLSSGKIVLKDLSGADYIYYRDAGNVVRRFYHCKGTWCTTSGSSEAIVPAGSAFWYMNNGSAKVTW